MGEAHVHFLTNSPPGVLVALQYFRSLKKDIRSLISVQVHSLTIFYDHYFDTINSGKKKITKAQPLSLF